MLEQVLGQRQKMRQEQIMAPQQLQSLEILTATLTEMEQKINQELEDNPTLEMVNSGLDELAGNPVEESEPAESEDVTVRDDDGSERVQEQNRLLENLIRLDENNRAVPSGPSFEGGDEESEERHRHFWDSLVSEQSFEDFLYEQLGQTVRLDERTTFICREIIGSIDHTGYLRSHLADIATACQCSLEEAENALRIVQSFEPPGIAARDLRECLLLQLGRQERRNSLAWRIVDKHLPELGQNQLQKIARKMNLPMPELKAALAEIRQLRPHPASHISNAQPTEFVVPEVFVELDQNGEPQVRANQEHVPSLRISSYYLKLLKNPETPEETKSYIREKITGSKQLLKMIEQREATIVRIARSLVKFQYDFFSKGIHHLVPLTMNQVAEGLGVHETTVSRAVANKYMMTPHGLYAFRFFFAAGYRDQNGEVVASQSIKQKIQELVSGENREQPLSDQQLSEKLKKDGYNLARRTIAKYREELAIPSSSLRRRF